MKYIDLLIITTIIAIAFPSCTRYEKIEDFPIEKPALVVNSFISAGKPVVAGISHSLSVLDNAQIEYINNAKVVLFENGSIADTLRYNDSAARYLSKINVVEGNSYQLKVSHPQYVSVQSAIESVPLINGIMLDKFIVLDSLTYTAINYYAQKADTMVQLNFQLSLTIKDKAGQNNWYEVYIAVDDSQANYSSGKQFFRSEINNLHSDDPSIINRTNDLSYGLAHIFLDDKLFDGKEHTLTLSTLTDKYGFYFTKDAKYYLFFRSLTESSYRYIRSLGENNENVTLFNEPTRVFSNIENGYGIFAGMSKYEFKLR